MRVFLYFCLMSALLAMSGSVVYKPCELVNVIREMVVFQTELDPAQLPLIVCIAGYRHYNTSYRLENTKNNTGYYGIFGLHNDDVTKTGCAGPAWNISNLIDDNIETDVRCLKRIILDSPIDLGFFQRMCSPSMVNNIPCPITSYVQANVLDPIDRSLFEKAFKKGGLPTPPPLPPSTTPTPCCCEGTDGGSKYWAFYITVPAILIALAYFAVKIAMKRRANQEPSLINA